MIKKGQFAHHLNEMLGLILGDTHIGQVIVKKLIKQDKKFIIIDISKKGLFKKEKTHSGYQLVNWENVFQF